MNDIKTKILGVAIISVICLGVVFHLNTIHKFKVGDCFINEKTEEWESDQIYKIKKVGKYKYLYITTNRDIFGLENLVEQSEKIDIIDNENKLIKCPE